MAKSFDEQIQKILKDFAEDVRKDADEIGKRLAKAGAKQINANASAMFRGSRYRRSWTSTEEKSRVGNKYTIHSKLPGLPHLLENGHASRFGGRVNGRVHIAPVEEELVKTYQEEIINAIQGR